MARTDLNVPFSEKDDAKKLGARWDVEKKIWYVPDNIDPKPFDQWIVPALKANGQPGDKPNIRCNRFCIAEGKRECWKCKKISRVYGFVLPRGFEELSENDGDVWKRPETDVILSYIQYLSSNAINAMKKITSSYFVDFHHIHYWENHCEHCQALQGDWYLFEEAETPFDCNSREVAKKMRLFYFDELFEAECGRIGHFKGFDMIELIHWQA